MYLFRQNGSFRILLGIWLSICAPCLAQTDSTNMATTRTAPQLKKGTVAIVGSITYATTLVGLSELWYAGEPRSGFHFYNDNAEWLQVDKVGHCYTAYQISRVGIAVLKQTDLNEKKAVLLGSLAGFVFQTPIEILDGFSAAYGASAGDLVANTVGSGLLLSQYLLWNEERIKFKFSYHPTDLASKRPNLLGGNFVESLLKDYNGQAYWLSLNPYSFTKNEHSFFPKWLSISLGYGADGMIGGHDNVWTDKKNGNTIDTYKNMTRHRQYYLSLDVDFSHIKTRNTWLKSLFFVLNGIRIPAPALELNSKGEIRFHPLYF